MSYDDIPERVGLTAERLLAHLARMDELATPLYDGDVWRWRSAPCQGNDPREHARCAHPSNSRRYDGCTCRCHRSGDHR